MRGVLLVLVLLAVAGCGARTDGLSVSDQATPEPLWGSTFLLTEGYIDGTPTTIQAGTEVSLLFTEDRRLVANAGCNTMSGPVTLDDGRLSTDGLAITEMGCDQPRHAQDEWLAGFLDGKPSWELAGGKLTLRGGDTELMLTERSVVDPDRPLEGTVWTVDTLVDGETAGSTPAGAPPTTVEFGPDRVSVFAGCNGGSANYRLDGDTITFDPLEMTTKGCPGDIMVLESAVVAVLEGSVTFDVESAFLTLNHPSGKGLRLRAE
jgi:heat shock protein HslJ